MTLTVRSLLIVLSAMFLVVGCGDDDKSAETTLDIDRVVAQAQKDGTAKVAATFDIEGFGLSEPLKVTGKGETSLTETEMRLVLEGGPILERLQLPLDDPIPVVLIGPSAHIEVPEALRSEVPGERPWITIDIGKASGTGAKGVEALFRFDTAGSLAPFQAGAPLVDDGKETIDGVETTRWTGEVSVEDFVGTLPEGERDEVRRSLTTGPDGMSAKDLENRQPITLWIDADGRLRRSLQVASSPATESTPAGKLTVQFDLSDFGGPAPIEPPAADDAHDVTDAILAQPTA